LAYTFTTLDKLCSPNSEKKCSLTRPLTTPNFVAVRQEVFEISAIEYLCSPKEWTKISPKLLKTCYPLKPPVMPYFIQIGDTTLEKSVTKVFFYTLQYFGSPGVPLGQRSPVWVVGYIIPSALATCKISSCSDDHSPRYLLPNFVDFVGGRDPQKHTVNDNVSALHAATTKERKKVIQNMVS